MFLTRWCTRCRADHGERDTQLQRARIAESRGGPIAFDDRHDEAGREFRQLQLDGPPIQQGVAVQFH